MLREARELHRQLLESDPNNSVYAFELIITSSALAKMEVRMGESASGETVARAGVEVARKFLSRTTEPRLHVAAAGALQSLGMAHAAWQRSAEALQLYEEALAVLEKLQPEIWTQQTAREIQAEIMVSLAESRAVIGPSEAADRAWELALWWRREEVRQSDRPAAAWALAQNLRSRGESLCQTGRRTDALMAWSEGLALVERLLAQEPESAETGVWRAEMASLLAARSAVLSREERP